MTDITTDTPTETAAATDSTAASPEATTPAAPSKPARGARKAPTKAAAKGKGTTKGRTRKATPARTGTAKADAAADVSTAPAPGVEMIPLADLDLSPLNPRAEASVDEAAIARLAVNIRAAGLIHDLAGLRGDDGRVAVVAGGRRLRALRLLHEAEPGSGRFATVPVKLAPDEATARLWAASENAARKPLHPADEVRQFGALRDRGLAVPQIATAFAATEAHVRRRLALAGLPGMVLDALRAGEINLDHAAAFTVVQDEARMREALAHVRGGQGHVSAAHLRGILAPRVPTFGDRRAAFVGLDAYEAAGGRVTRDLFSEAVYLHDEATLERVFEERLVAEACRVRSEEGWLWAEAMPAAQWIGWHEIEGRGLTPTYPEAGELTSEEWEAFEDLTAATEDGALDEDARARLDALEAAGRDSFTQAQRAVAGALVHVGLSGRLEVAPGLIRLEDREAAMEAGVLPRARHTHVAADGTVTEWEGDDGPFPAGTGDAAGTGGDDGASGAAAEGTGTTDEAPALPPHSAALTSDLDAIRTGAVQAALLDHPDLLLDLLAFGFSPASGAHGRALDFHPGRPPRPARRGGRLHRRPPAAGRPGRRRRPGSPALPHRRAARRGLRSVPGQAPGGPHGRPGPGARAPHARAGPGGRAALRRRGRDGGGAGPRRLASHGRGHLRPRHGAPARRHPGRPPRGRARRRPAADVPPHAEGREGRGAKGAVRRSGEAHAVARHPRAGRAYRAMGAGGLRSALTGGVSSKRRS